MKIRPRTSPYHNFVRTTFAASQFTDPEHIVRDEFTHCTLGIAGEGYEVCEARIDHLFCGLTPETSEARTAYVKELGDLCYYVAMLENTLDKYVATTLPAKLVFPVDVVYKITPHTYSAHIWDYEFIKGSMHGVPPEPNELIPPQELFGPDISSFPNTEFFPPESLADFQTNYPYSLEFKHVETRTTSYLNVRSIDKKIHIVVNEETISLMQTDYLRVLPTYQKYVDIDFPTYIEGFLDYTKRVLYYRTADWSLLPIYIRGFWAFITVFAHVDLQMTLQDILAVNEAKLRKRYPSGSFSPEDATRKADNDT
jgi:hypothetical protein